jgi:Cu2+-exporting ATPase
MVRATDRIAGPFLWTVLALAAAAVAVWSVIDPPRALWVGVAVLIVTCPCALSLAAPAALLSAAGALARRGVLVQRLDAFESLARSDVACFDKTGTLTEDRLVLADTRLPAAADGEGLKSRAASLAALSRHPLSVALAAALPAAQHAWREVRELPGQGIEAIDESGRRWRLGSPGWTGVASAHVGRPTVCLAPADAAGHEQACFEFDEALRDDAVEALASLRAQGMALRLLGRASASAQALAAKVGIADVRGDASPQDKLDALARWQRDGHCVLMVGDGVNDAPVLARADVSFAMGSGADAAQRQADFILLGDSLREIADPELQAVLENLAKSLAKSDE